MAWHKYAFLGVVAYLLGAVSLAAGLAVGINLLNFPDIPGEGHPAVYMLVVIGTLGVFPGAATAFIFFLVEWLLRHSLRRSTNPGLGVLVAMVVAQVLTFLLGFVIIVYEYSNLDSIP